MTSTMTTALACVMLLSVACAALAQKADDADAQATSAERRLSGPYTHDNLTIFLVHGKSTLKGNYLTLEEAMEAKVVKVHETGDVNELAIENVGRERVFVQSGDIVKGGKQDRCIATDFTLDPKSGKVKIAAFCVEQGRWRQRGGESAALFSSSSGTVTGNKLKLAGNANYSGGGQQKVWDEVKATQQQLSRHVAAEVAAPASPSSLQLTLENEKVQQAIEAYVKALADAPGAKEDVIGYAAVINGKLNCADVYGSSQLFRKIWPRALKSVATEAAGEARADEKLAELPAEQVEAALRDAADGKRTTNDVGDAVQVITTDSDDIVQFESRARGEAGYLRQSIVNKQD